MEKIFESKNKKLQLNGKNLELVQFKSVACSGTYIKLTINEYYVLSLPPHLFKNEHIFHNFEVETYHKEFMIELLKNNPNIKYFRGIPINFLDHSVKVCLESDEEFVINIIDKPCENLCKKLYDVVDIPILQYNKDIYKVINSYGIYIKNQKIELLIPEVDKIIYEFVGDFYYDKINYDYYNDKITLKDDEYHVKHNILRFCGGLSACVFT